MSEEPREDAVRILSEALVDWRRKDFPRTVVKPEDYIPQAQFLLERLKQKGIT